MAVIHCGIGGINNKAAFIVRWWLQDNSGKLVDRADKRSTEKRQIMLQDNMIDGGCSGLWRQHVLVLRRPFAATLETKNPHINVYMRLTA